MTPEVTNANTTEEVFSKLFTIINQLGPNLIITAQKDATLELAFENWESYVSTYKLLKLSRSDLPDETAILVMGQLADSFKSMHNLLKW